MISEETKKVSSKKLKLQPRPTDLDDLEELNIPKKKTSSKKKLEDKENGTDCTPSKPEPENNAKSVSKTGKKLATKSKPRCNVRSDLKSKTTPKATTTEEVANLTQTENIPEKYLKASSSEKKPTETNITSEEHLKELIAENVGETLKDDADELVAEGRPTPVKGIAEAGQHELDKKEDLGQDQQEHQEDKVQCDGAKENPSEGEKLLENAEKPTEQPKEDILVEDCNAALVPTGKHFFIY